MRWITAVCRSRCWPGKPNHRLNKTNTDSWNPLLIDFSDVLLWKSSTRCFISGVSAWYFSRMKLFINSKRVFLIGSPGWSLAHATLNASHSQLSIWTHRWGRDTPDMVVAFVAYANLVCLWTSLSGPSADHLKRRDVCGYGTTLWYAVVIVSPFTWHDKCNCKFTLCRSCTFFWMACSKPPAFWTCSGVGSGLGYASTHSFNIPWKKAFWVLSDSAAAKALDRDFSHASWSLVVHFLRVIRPTLGIRREMASTVLSKRGTVRFCYKVFW